MAEPTESGARAWIVCGPPGSGKSVLGRALAIELGATLLDQDVATGPFTTVVTSLVGAARDDLDDPRVREAVGTAPYDVLFDLAAANLAPGRAVVLVAPFTRLLASAESVESVRARLAPAELRVIRADCPPDELLRRLARRGAERDRRKLADPASFLEVERTLAVSHRVVDTTRPLAEQLVQATARP